MRRFVYSHHLSAKQAIETDVTTAISAILPKGIHRGDSGKRLRFAQIKETPMFTLAPTGKEQPRPQGFSFSLVFASTWMKLSVLLEHPLSGSPTSSPCSSRLSCVQSESVVVKLPLATATFSSYGILPLNTAYKQIGLNERFQVLAAVRR